MPRDVIFNNSNWLSNSLVGTVRWEGVIPSIPGIYKDGGCKDVKVARLGQRKVLISFPNLQEAKTTLGDSCFASNQVFIERERWVPSNPYLLELSGFFVLVFLSMDGIRRSSRILEGGGGGGGYCQGNIGEVKPGGREGVCQN